MIHWLYWNCKTTPDDVFAWRQSGWNVESQASGVVIANRRFAAANGGRSRLWPVDETSVEIQVPEDSAPEAGSGGLEEKPAGERFLLQWFYDPELGRFLSNDPAHQRLNPYQYCDNNPLSNIDENGEFLDWLFAGLLKGVNKWWDNVKNGRGTSWDDFTNAVGQGMIDYGKEITGYAGLERGYNQFKSGLDNAIKGYTDALSMMNSIKLGLSLPKMGELNLGGLADVGKGIGSLAGTVSQINLSDIGNRMGTMAKGAVDVANKAVMAVPNEVYDAGSSFGALIPEIGPLVSRASTVLGGYKTSRTFISGTQKTSDYLGIGILVKGAITAKFAKAPGARTAVNIAYGTVSIGADVLGRITGQ